MATTVMRVPRLSDQALAEGLRGLCKEFAVPKVHIKALGNILIGAVPFPEDANNKAWQELLAQDSFLVTVANLDASVYHIAYSRGGAAHQSLVYDEISLSPLETLPNWNDPSLQLLVVRSLQQRFNPFIDLDHTALNDDQAAARAIHESTLIRLELLNEKLIRETNDYRQTLDTEQVDKRKKLEEEYVEKRSKLDEANALEITRIDERKAELDDQLKKIDDRNNTHARRQIRDSMLVDVSSRIKQFGVSFATNSKRWPVGVGILSIAAVFALLLHFTASELREMDVFVAKSVNLGETFKRTAAEVESIVYPTGQRYWLWSRLAVLSFGLVAAVLYFVRWQNKWADHHATSEFALQQFYLDVNRANWIIESCLEWRKETQSPIPRELLSSITNGLFANQQPSTEQVLHPADELASALLGSASKLTLKAGENTMEFSKPSGIPKSKKVEGQPDAG